MDELERLKKEVTDKLVKYVKLNNAYNAKLPVANEEIPAWVFNLEYIEELDKMDKAVREAHNEWTSKLREYLEKKNK